MATPDEEREATQGVSQAEREVRALRSFFDRETECAAQVVADLEIAQEALTRVVRRLAEEEHE